MEKRFNITGKCIATQHYMADVSKKLESTLKMVVDGEYFIINKPRQFGKTTTLHNLADLLRKTGDYIVFTISFGGLGDAIFENEVVFSEGFVKALATYAKYQIPDLASWLYEATPHTKNLDTLSEVITELVSKTDKKIIVTIDEVDKSSNNQLFVSFLAMLREKYLVRDEIKTFHSIVLAGVHDVKSLKLKLRPNDEQKYNSPWNIAAEFKVNMHLQPFEIKPMLEAYSLDKGVTMNTQEIAERLFFV